MNDVSLLRRRCRNSGGNNLSRSPADHADSAVSGNAFVFRNFSYAAIIVALLFGLIHLEVNPITAAAAFVLGLLSGELRHRSGSLLPAILVHAVFNAFAAIL